MATQIRNHRGQVALWVIVAVVIVGLSIVLLSLKKEPKPAVEVTLNPRPFLESCIGQEIERTLENMLPQGGFVAPTDTIQYRNASVAYLCKNEGYFEPCVHQHPLYLEELRLEIEKATRSGIEQCFTDMKERAEQEQAKVILGELTYTIELAPQRVRAVATRTFDIEQRNARAHFGEFVIDVSHPIYGLALVALEIVSQEAKYCSFEYVGYMMLYPRYDIRKTALSEGTKVYAIRDTASRDELMIAVRGCVLPAGV